MMPIGSLTPGTRFQFATGSGGGIVVHPASTVLRRADIHSVHYLNPENGRIYALDRAAMVTLK